jgi:hypothetical protein
LQAQGEFALVTHTLANALDKAGQPVKRGTMAHEHDIAMLLADTAANRRDLAELERWVPRLEALVERDGHPLYNAIALRARGVAQRLAGDSASSEASLKQALSAFDALGARWQSARTRLELAETSAMADAPEADQQRRSHLAEALAAFEALAARPDADRTRAALQTISPV